MTTTAGENASPALCFLCQTIAKKIAWRESPYEGRQCTCGLLYTSPTPTEDAIDVTDDHHHDHFYAYSAELKCNWMSSHCPTGRLLEVGCGKGAFLSAAQHAGYDVLGLDASRSRCQHVREERGLPVIESTFEKHQIHDQKFDVVYHCDLLAHFADPEWALREMASLLNPGGVLCFEVGILGGLSPLWYRMVGKIGLGHHLWLYSKSSLDKLYSKAGMEVVHQKRFGLAPSVFYGRASSLGRFGKRLLTGGDKSLRRSEPSQRHVRCQHFFRYRVGAVAPSIGPQTMFVVLKPA